jgi:hypothetical protein
MLSRLSLDGGGSRKSQREKLPMPKTPPICPAKRAILGEAEESNVPYCAETAAEKAAAIRYGNVYPAWFPQGQLIFLRAFSCFTFKIFQLWLSKFSLGAQSSREWAHFISTPRQIIFISVLLG